MHAVPNISTVVFEESTFTRTSGTGEKKVADFGVFPVPFEEEKWYHKGKGRRYEDVCVAVVNRHVRMAVAGGEGYVGS